jgi:alkanesulfonate monooxygenase SsuD/methylene tetrahydromethanopterin reductase-like flavin-dependent oxidoreductase (luciferase family)
MRVGISLTSNHPDVTDPRQAARWMIERTAAARRAGLDSLFIGDQHVSATPYYQNTPMLGRLLAEWGEAPSGCPFLLPLWHPVLVAEQIGTLAAIAQGPFIMQCGLGWGEARFAAMGANFRTRPSAFEEALDIVRRLLAGETVSSSRRFRITQASLALRPANRRGLDRRQRPAGHRPRGAPLGGLDREPQPHPRRGARPGRTLS